jgi:2-iminobutanoate/2-iminopropanoate deaminase
VKRILSCALIALAAGACAHAAPPARYVPMSGPVKRPFSAAVVVNGMVYLSGQLGTDSTGHVVQGGITAETKQALENIRALLAANGASMDDVVKCTAMLADMSEWGQMNEVYATYFPHHFPARSAFGTTGLALGGRIELECFAVVPPAK